MSAYELFAAIIDYPAPELAACVRDCIACVRPTDAEAAELLNAFGARLADLGTTRLQELYTATFDLRADTSLYAGHHLFGESGRRNLFMGQLSGEYRQCGFARGNDLPDHLAVMLRFLGHTSDAELAHELMVDCLVPVVTRVVGRLEKGQHPYAFAFRALVLWLQHCAAELEQPAKRSAG